MSERQKKGYKMADETGFDEIAAAEEILVAQRERRHQLQIRQARQGDNTAVEVLTEIERYNQLIANQEAEVRRLKTESVQDVFSLAEAEYRKALATAWSESGGRPNVAAAEGLEVLRLRLGIPREREQELERDIRQKLAQQAFYAIPRHFLSSGWWLTPDGAKSIGRPLRFDLWTTLNLVMQHIESDVEIEPNEYQGLLIQANNVWVGQDEYTTFSQFVSVLANRLEQRRAEEA